MPESKNLVNRNTNLLSAQFKQDYTQLYSVGDYYHKAVQIYRSLVPFRWHLGAMVLVDVLDNLRSAQVCGLWTSGIVSENECE